MTISKIFYCLLFLLLIFSCATQVVPTGGAKDVLPPKIKTTTPPNLSKQVRPSKINIELSEYFTLDNPLQNITISPPISENLTFLIKGKNLQVNIPEGTLQDSTTYTINFGVAIRDNNEGNVQDSFKFVFSTGSYLDSSSLSGIVKDAFTNDVAEGLIVGLYKLPIDSLNQKPFYYTKTDKAGSFRLDNLKQGGYQIIAFKDENATLTKDLVNEKMAFLNNPVMINDSALPVTLLAFQEKQQTRLLEYDYKQPGFLQFIINQPTSKVSLSPVDEETKFPLEDSFLYYNTTKDTLRLYYTASEKNTFSLLFQVDNVTLDTIKVSLKHTETDSIKKYAQPIGVLSGLMNVSKKGLSRLTSTQNITLINLGKIDFQKAVALTLNMPISKINRSDIMLMEDTIVQNELLEIDSLSPMRFSFHVKQGQNWKTDKPYKIMLSDSCFKDYVGNFNKPIQLSFTTTKPDDYGSISIKLDSLKADKQYIMHFLSEKKQVLQQEIIENKITGLFEYKKLLPGKYFVRLIVDDNKNQQWDTGNYAQQRQPETIINFAEPIEVRAKWDNEINFIVGIKRTKP